VPEISRFYGIVITMFYDDHGPPHFHAHYAGFEAQIELSALTVLHGDLPPRALGLVAEWARLHAEELTADWRLARERQPLRRIPPL